MRRLGFLAAGAASVALAVAACAPSPATSPEAAAIAVPRTDAPFPPRSPVSLELRSPPAAGAHYHIVSEIEGEQEVVPPSGRGRPKTRRDTRRIELHYRQVPTRAPEPSEIASVLVLEALRVQTRQDEPPLEREVELADDRLRTLENGEVGLDLRGAQPREQLTPRKLLDRPFAVMRQDRSGHPLGIVIRAPPFARDFYDPFPVRELVAWTRVARPLGPVEPGAHWMGKRFPSHGLGTLGLPLDLRYELAGYEEVKGAGCAWILIHAELDAEQVPSQHGFRFERATARVDGQAWIELATGLVRRLRLEDDVRVAFRRGRLGTEVIHRLRYRSRTRLERSAGPPRETWLDKTPFFEAR